MMTKLSLAGCAVLGSVMISSAAVTYQAQLDPFQEVPPHSTPGYGSADLSLSGTTLSIDANTGVYADLLAGATAVTVNDAAVGANGAVVFSLTLDTPGNTTGTFSGSGTLTAGQITDLQAGNLYLNVRDSVFPNGEIRGQILAVPEASTTVAGGLAVMAACAIFRPRKGLA